MVFVLFAISVITFFIFYVIPGGRSRAADRRPQRRTRPVREQVREDFGFNDPLYVQYCRMMEKTFNGEPELLLEPGQRARGDRSAASPRPRRS